MSGPREVLERGGGREGEGLQRKTLCTKNGPTRFFRSLISVFPTMVTSVWGLGRGAAPGGGGGGYPLLLWEQPF